MLNVLFFLACFFIETKKNHFCLNVILASLNPSALTLSHTRQHQELFFMERKTKRKFILIKSQIQKY
jgi:hypothetical protein